MSKQQIKLPIELYGKLLLHEIIAVNILLSGNDQYFARNDPCKN